jgi:hypothetical protein
MSKKSLKSGRNEGQREQERREEQEDAPDDLNLLVLVALEVDVRLLVERPSSAHNLLILLLLNLLLSLSLLNLLRVRLTLNRRRSALTLLSGSGQLLLHLDLSGSRRRLLNLLLLDLDRRGRRSSGSRSGSLLVDQSTILDARIALLNENADEERSSVLKMRVKPQRVLKALLLLISSRPQRLRPALTLTLLVLGVLLPALTLGVLRPLVVLVPLSFVDDGDVVFGGRSRGGLGFGFGRVGVRSGLEGIVEDLPGRETGATLETGKLIRDGEDGHFCARETHMS